MRRLGLAIGRRRPRITGGRPALGLDSADGVVRRQQLGVGCSGTGGGKHPSATRSSRRSHFARRLVPGGRKETRSRSNRKGAPLRPVVERRGGKAVCGRGGPPDRGVVWASAGARPRCARRRAGDSPCAEGPTPGDDLLGTSVAWCARREAIIGDGGGEPGRRWGVGRCAGNHVLAGRRPPKGARRSSAVGRMQRIVRRPSWAWSETTPSRRARDRGRAAMGIAGRCGERAPERDRGTWFAPRVDLLFFFLAFVPGFERDRAQRQFGVDVRRDDRAGASAVKRGFDQLSGPEGLGLLAGGGRHHQAARGQPRHATSGVERGIAARRTRPHVERR